MFNLKVYLIILAVTFSTLCFSDQIDPTAGSKTGIMESPVSNENYPVTNFGSRDLTPPIFEITHVENGGVTIQVTSDEALYTGWVDDKLIWHVDEFDYYFLNTRISKDPQNNIYAAVNLYEYSNPNNNYDMYKLFNNGEIQEEFNNWNGPGGNPLIINNPDKNIYLENPTIDYEGIVDETNVTYIAYTNGGTSILFSKIGVDGTILIDQATIVTGANSWTNEARIAVDSNDEFIFNKIYVVWPKDLFRGISYVYSEDGGYTWSEEISLCYDSSSMMNKPHVCCDSNNNVHIIWQYWTGGDNVLSYMKLRPDGTIAIDTSSLTQSGNNVWFLQMDIDEENNLHIIWANDYSGNPTSAYYTKINGNLDANGASLTDVELSLIQEYPFISNQRIKYPKCVVDGYFNVHTFYEYKEDGCRGSKTANYKKMNAPPYLRIEYPNDSVLFVKMTGDGTDWEGTFTSTENGVYDVRISGSDIDGNTGVDNYEFEYTGVIVDDNKLISNNLSLLNYPNPFNPTTTISFTLNTENTEDAELIIYNIKGQKVKQFSILNNQSSIVWNGKDENDKTVSSGIYFYKLKSGKFIATKKMILMN